MIDPLAVVVPGGMLILLLVGAMIDLQTRRIPNWLTFGGAFLGIAVNGAIAQVEGVRWSIVGWIVGVLLLVIPFAMRGVGGGDVKLLAAVGAWGGPQAAVGTLLFGAIAGAVAALAFLIVTGNLGYVLRPFGTWVRSQLILAAGLIAPGALGWRRSGYENVSAMRHERPRLRLPYGPALAFGGVVTVLLAQWGQVW